MSLMHLAPLALSILIGLLLGLMAWGSLEARRDDHGDAVPAEMGEILLLWLLALAGFGMSIFLMYILI
jgi:hypothetical protein